MNKNNCFLNHIVEDNITIGSLLKEGDGSNNDVIIRKVFENTWCISFMDVERMYMIPVSNGENQLLEYLTTNYGLLIESDEHQVELWHFRGKLLHDMVAHYLADSSHSIIKELFKPKTWLNYFDNKSDDEIRRMLNSTDTFAIRSLVDIPSPDEFVRQIRYHNMVWKPELEERLIPLKYYPFLPYDLTITTLRGNNKTVIYGYWDSKLSDKQYYIDNDDRYGCIAFYC